MTTLALRFGVLAINVLDLLNGLGVSNLSKIPLGSRQVCMTDLTSCWPNLSSTLAKNRLWFLTVFFSRVQFLETNKSVYCLSDVRVVSFHGKELQLPVSRTENHTIPHEVFKISRKSQYSKVLATVSGPTNGYIGDSASFLSGKKTQQSALCQQRFMHQF